MSTADRDTCIQAAAQHRADAHAKFWPWVKEIGPAAAARAVWYPGHAAGSPEAIQKVLERRLAERRGAA